ncbi:tyrosinase family protein [Edaphocola flava]|uniref:tyrosinase family protein n=1 Tax=Edaphocola flava TaxID=2499629 RepID=UPI0013875249|nr:tyrosinase family protein [Edaphocola flava]
MTTLEQLNQAPTWHGAIKNYFTPGDIACMRSVRGFDLGNYSFVVSHAPDIYQRVSLPPDAPGRMPEDSDPWTSDMISNFLAWMEAGYPEGKPEPVMMRKMEAAAVAGRLRKSLTSLSSEEVDLLKTAFAGIMALGTEDLNGYFQNAAIHGLPLAYCQHHDPGFQPWHRVQMWAFENCLLTIKGCENVTLPYWDFNELLPSWMYEAPFDSYTLPVDISAGSTSPYYKKGYQTQRYSPQQIMTNFNNDVVKSFANAQTEQWWDNFNGLLDNTPNLDFIQGHDSGHDSTGDTMSRQNVSAFDPIFWFYHCNLDRMWWIWQANHDAQDYEGFMKTIKNKNSSSYTVFTNNVVGKMNPWALNLKRDDLTAAYTIDLNNFDVAYESMVLSLPEPIEHKQVSLGMARVFETDIQEVNVRVDNLNRTRIPGTFKVHLLKDGVIIDSSVFFQPDEVQKCENCMKNPVVHFDFRLPLQAVEGGLLSIQVEPNEKEMYGDTVPLKVLGNPEISVALLMKAP